MKLSRVRIRRLRSLEDVEVSFGDYTCLVGANGAGKSTVLCALNVFFRETENTGTDLTRLDREDFFLKDTSQPIEITVTFTDLSPEAQEDFKEYYRQGQLVVSAIATFNEETGKADVKQFGQRLGFKSFKPFFEKYNDGARADDLRNIYNSLRGTYPDLPSPGPKEAMARALREYEAARPEKCDLIPSEDQFYGFSRGSNRLDKYLQWVYVPAVKDAATEQAEAKNGALAKLLARTVRAKTKFADEVAKLRDEARAAYQKLLDSQQDTLAEVSAALQARLTEWAHPNATLRVQWREDPGKSVKVEEPTAYVVAGEGVFAGDLARLGHGLQRSYIIALLQELAGAGGADGPRLILGCEEPELYQHPPQARHLAEVLRRLSNGNAQVIVSTHSPFFVTGDVFEDVRVVRRCRKDGRSTISAATFEQVAALIHEATGRPLEKREAVLVKLHQALQPSLCELFFTPKPVFVEGTEDMAYILSWLHLAGRWEEFRRSGCHLIATLKKSEMIRPLAVAAALNLDRFVIFDADGDEPKSERRKQHEVDNTRLLKLCGVVAPDPFPTETLWGERLVVWPSCLTKIVREEIGSTLWHECQRVADQIHGHAGDLGKNSLHVATSLAHAWKQGGRSASLERLCSEILAFGAV